MKKIALLIFACSTFIGFQACEDNEDPVFIAQEAQAPRIVTPNSVIEISRELAEKKVLTIVWDDANYTIATPITYNIEAAAAGKGFKEPIAVASTSERYYSWTAKELNELAIKAGLENDMEGSLEIRIRSMIGTNQGAIMLSNNTIVTMTPYQAVLPVINLFFVGNATDTNKDGVANDEDWNNNAINTYLFRDAKNSKMFYFKGNFEANEFKLLEQKGQWQPQWGLDNDALSNSETLGSDPASFVIPTSGYYSLELNIEELTYSITPIDVSTATTYTSMGLMGSARTGDDTGWDENVNPDTDLIQSQFNPHIWYLEKLEVFDGELKIRANDAWDNSWGSDQGLSAQGSNNNDSNISITAGTYEVWFNDLDGRFIFLPTI